MKDENKKSSSFRVHPSAFILHPSATILLLQRPDLDVLPATGGADRPALAAVYLDGNAPLGAELSGHFLFVVVGAGERLAVELADLDAVQPGGDLRRLADARDAGRVPFADFPGLDPLVAAGAVTLGC